MSLTPWNTRANIIISSDTDSTVEVKRMSHRQSWVRGAVEEWRVGTTVTGAARLPCGTSLMSRLEKGGRSKGAKQSATKWADDGQIQQQHSATDVSLRRGYCSRPRGFSCQGPNPMPRESQVSPSPAVRWLVGWHLKGGPCSSQRAAGMSIPPSVRDKPS